MTDGINKTVFTISRRRGSADTLDLAGFSSFVVRITPVLDPAQPERSAYWRLGFKLRSDPSIESARIAIGQPLLHIFHDPNSAKLRAF